MSPEYVDPFLKQGFDGTRIRCGGCLGGLLILGSVASAVPLLFVPIWQDVSSEDLLRWKPLPGRPAPKVSATLFHFDFEKPEWTGSTGEQVPGFDWLDFCRYNVNDTLPVAQKLIEGTIFSPEPLEADPQVCLGASAASWLTMVGVLSIATADLFILLSGLCKSILLLLFGGWLALLSAFALLLALAGLFLVDAKHLGTAPGVILLGTSVAMAFVGTTMALYQAMRATPDQLPKPRPKWKEDDEELTEEEEKKRVQQILVECLDYDIPRLERYRVSMNILEECAEEEISYEEWIIEERLRMKTGKSRRAILTEEELQKATVELRIRRRPHPVLAQCLEVMLEEAKKGRGAGMVPVPLLEEAFQGIDVTLRNHITTRELLAALRVCGIFVESPAAELLLHWLHKQEQQAPGLGGGDPQNLGIIDLPKFINLFNQVTDMLAKEFMFKKASRGYQLTCRLAFLMNLSFLCVVLFSVTRPDADESWQSLLNVFGTLFALQFSAVIAVPMLCSVLGRKARVWRQHFCLQLMACLAPIFWLGGKLGACLCRVLLFLKGCCGLCELCCGKLPDEEAPEEAPDAPMQQTMSEGGRRASTDKSGRRGSTGRRGSSETGSRRGSFGTGRRGSTETGSRRGSTGTGRRGSTGTGRRGSTETGRRGSRDSGQRGSKDSGPKDSKESGHRASPDGRRSSTQSSHRGSDLGSGGSGGYTLGEDDDLMGFPSEESDSTFLFSEGGDSVSSDVMHEVQKFRMERKQVRSPTTPLRSAGLAFKSEDEVFSYPVGRRKKPRRASSDSRAGSAAEVEEAWTEEVPKKKRRRRSQKGGRRASGGGGFFRSLLGSKEELTVVKEMSLNSQQSTGSTRSRRGNSPGSPGRRSSLGSLGTHSSSSSHRRKDSKGSKGSKGSRTNSKSSRLAQLGSASRSFFQRLLSRRRSSVEEPMGYDPKTYDAAAWRAAQGRNTSSFSPMQVRNLRAPDLLAPPMLHEISDLGSTTEGWGWSKVSWGQATDSQSRMVTKDAKDLRSEDVP